MTIYQLELFLALADRKVFSAVADELYVVQSTLSKQIKALENELDTRLFTRKSRGVELTAAGELLQEHAKRIMEEYRDLKKDILPFTRNRHRSLVVCGEPGLTPYGILEIFEQHKRMHSGLEIKFLERPFYELLHLLDKKEADIALVWEENVNLSGYCVQHILEEEMVLIISARHPLAERNKPIELSELKNEPVSVLLYGYARPLTYKLWHDAGFGPVNIYEVLRTSSQFELAASGKAVGLVCGERANKWGNPDVVPLRIQNAPTLHLLSVCIEKDMTAEIRELLYLLKSNISGGCFEQAGPK